MTDRRRATILLAGLAAVSFLLNVAVAGAVILPAATIDGPSEEIVGFGGIAMAEDGTAGVVYLKRVDGVAHVFVARYVAGHWSAPIQIDTAEPFAASEPRIGAADGGELVVVWATPFASIHEQPVDQLLSSTLGPGASRFGPAMLVDGNIGQGIDADPDLAMSSTGQADVVYRVVREPEANGPAVLHPGDVNEEVRVAHYTGERWSALGAINRDPAVAMRPPTQANAPQIAIGPTGNGVVVWQEPEVNGVARIWARRLFGSSLDYAMLVSATSFDGVPIEEDSDAPSVAFTRLGQAEVAYRQAVGPGSPLPGPRIFVNDLPNGESSAGSEFQGAIVADASVPGGMAAAIGPPNIDIDEKESLRLLYDSDGTPRVVNGNDLGLTGTLSLGPPFVVSKEQQERAELPSSASVMNPEGGGISAWPSADRQGDPAVAVREDFPEGAVQTALVSGGAGGPIAALAVGRSGLGDGLVAFQQGPLGNAAIVAAKVTAPPDTFVVSVPKGWIKQTQARISWQPASSADGPLTYTVVLDGHRLATPAGALSLTIEPDQLGDGIHHVQLLATDVYAQSTLTPPSKLEVDGQPPLVKLTSRGSEVTVRVSDALSGVDAQAVSVSFGDGQRASGRKLLRHRYAHAGLYTVTVRARDKIGNEGVVRRLVSVR